MYSKLKSKPALAEKLNKYINNFNKTGNVYLGFLHLSFNKLEHSKDILRNCLLQNPHISNVQFENVLRLYGVKLGFWSDTGNFKVFEQDIGQLMSQKGTLTILSQIRDKFTENVQDTLSGVSNISDSGDKEMKSFSQGYQAAGCMDGHTLKNLALNSGGQLLFKYILHFLESAGKTLHLAILLTQSATPLFSLYPFLSPSSPLSFHLSCPTYFPFLWYPSCIIHFQTKIPKKLCFLSQKAKTVDQ